MAKIRLLAGLRNDLYQLALDTVECPAEKKALDRAYERAETKVIEMLTTTYPESEMLVLQKWKSAYTVAQVHYRLASGGDMQFEFKDIGPLIPREYRYQFYLANEKMTEFLQTWQAAVAAYETAIKNKRSDYKALIQSSSSFEDIVAIWPEAERLRPKNANSITTVSAELIARIKADEKNRKKAA